MNAIVDSVNVWGARFAGFALPMLLQSSVLITLLFGLDLVLRKRVRATARYALWMLALVKLALPPSLASPTGAAYWLPAETAGKHFAPAAIVVKTTYSAGGAVPMEFTWQAVFFMVWLAAAVGMGSWVVWRWRTVAGVMRQSVEVPQTVRALLESCRGQSGISRAIPVRCAEIGSPAICGILRPVILIPPVLVEKLGEAEMRPVLLHELAHYKRGDLLVNHAQILLQILYWYNPLLWLANACIRRVREQAVDEMVLVEMGEEAEAYPAVLLHVAKLGLDRSWSAIGLMGILEPGRGLTQRIQQIMNRSVPRTARIGARGLGAMLLLAFIALPMGCHHVAEPAPQAILSLPAQQKASAREPALMLKISKNGAMTLQSKPVTLDNLQTTLKEVSEQKPYDLVLMPDKDVDQGQVNKVQDMVDAAADPPKFTSELLASPSNKVTSITFVEPLVTATVGPKHWNPSGIIAKIRPMLSNGGGIISDLRTHKLIISATPGEMPAIKVLIAKLDAESVKTPSNDGKDTASLEPLVIAVVDLKHWNLAGIIAKIQPMLSNGSSIISDSRTHRLIIRVTAGEMPAIKAVIAKLDTDLVKGPKVPGSP